MRKNTSVRAAAALAAIALLPAGAAAGEGGLVELTRGAATEWSLWTDARLGAPGRFAAGELRKYVERLSGAVLGEAPSPEAPRSIRFRLRSGGETGGPPRSPGYDGYGIIVAPLAIVVAADEPRGAVYAAYDILERLGCRWFYPEQDPGDPEVVPRKEVLALPAGSWSVASPIRHRLCNGSAWFFRLDLAAAGRQLDWAMKNRFNGMGWQAENATGLAEQYERMRAAGLIDELERRGMILHGPGHAFDRCLPHEEFFEEHPEWFGLREGKRVPQTVFGAQFCWSNAEARRVFVSRARAFALACPAIRILYLAPFDGGPPCECAECKRAGASALLLKLLGELIADLEGAAPGVMVEALGGYGPVIDPPAGAAIHPRQRVLWAHWGRHHGMAYDDPRYGMKANLEAWRAAARGGLTICQYYTDNFCQPWIMPPFAHAIAGDRRYFVEKSVDALYLLMWPPGYWWNHGLNAYLTGRCFYDASLDPWAEIGDYARRYYGEAAGAFLARYHEEWARDLDLAYRVRDGCGERERKILARQRADLIDPAVAAARGDPVLDRRVGKIAKLHALAESLAGMHRLREEIRATKAAGRAAEARALVAEARGVSDHVLEHFQRLAELDQGLIDRNEVRGFLKMFITGWVDEAAK